MKKRNSGEESSPPLSLFAYVLLRVSKAVLQHVIGEAVIPVNIDLTVDLDRLISL